MTAVSDQGMHDEDWVEALHLAGALLHAHRMRVVHFPNPARIECLCGWSVPIGRRGHRIPANRHVARVLVDAGWRPGAGGGEEL